MQQRIFSAALAAQTLLLVASAQDVSGLPQCAQGPSLKSIGSTGCQLTDIACICKDQDYTSSLSASIKSVCSPADYQQTLKFTQQLCGGVSVTLSGAAPMPTTKAAGSSSIASVSTTSAASSQTSSGGAAASTASSTGGSQLSYEGLWTGQGMGFLMVGALMLSYLHAMAM